MSAIVVDTSVAAAWFIEEVGSPSAARLRDEPGGLLAPSYLLAELSSALLKATRRGLVPQGHALRALGLLRRTAPIAFVDTPMLIERATTIAEQISHPVHECLYLALAQREGSILASFDRRMAGLARRLAIRLWDPAA